MLRLSLRPIEGACLTAQLLGLGRGGGMRRSRGFKSTVPPTCVACSGALAPRRGDGRSRPSTGRAGIDRRSFLLRSAGAVLSVYDARPAPVRRGHRRAAPGDGKTTVARHLAAAAARMGARVLLALAGVLSGRARSVEGSIQGNAALRVSWAVPASFDARASLGRLLCSSGWYYWRSSIILDRAGEAEREPVYAWGW
jgi:hypothetical protein